MKNAHQKKPFIFANRAQQLFCFRICLAAALFVLVLFSSFSQTNTVPQNSPPPSNHTTPVLSPTPTPKPEDPPPVSNNPARPEIDDEQLLTLLLSDKTRNLHQWGTISQFHGLPSDRVNAIAQTPDGFLWFGTDLGLAKFDGRRVQTVSAENFSDNRILALETDHTGNLWIGTGNGGFVFQNNSFQPIPQTSDKSIVSIIFTETGRALLASENGFIFDARPNDSGALQVEIVLEKNLSLKSLAARDGNLLVGTNNGGLLRVAGSETREIINRPRIANINALEFDPEGNLLIGANQPNGLFVAKNLTEPKRLGENLGSVSSLASDENSNLWVGMKEQGAFQFRGTDEINHFTFENTAGGLRSNEILSIFVDRENVVWFGTAKGISRFDPNSPRSENISPDLNSKFIRTLFQSADGKIYAGTKRGLFVSERAGNWQSVANFGKRTIYSIAENANRVLLLGTPRGLVFYPAKSNSPKASLPAEAANSQPGDADNQTPAGSVRAIQTFRGKTFLAVFDQGLAEAGNTGILQVLNNLPEIKRATTLKADSEKKLWVGTAENGVFYFDGERISPEPKLDLLKSKPVWAIEGTEENGLWFGTENGLFLFHKGELQLILPEIAVRGIALSADGNGVWCATDKNGLIRLGWNRDFGWISSRLDVEQGLPSQRVFTLLAPNTQETGKILLVGTNSGIVRYQLPAVRPILIPTRILSRRLHATSELNSQITLEYPQNTLTVDVTAMSSRTFPEQFQYAFLLLDKSNHVIRKKFGKDSQFLMDNLSAGEYALEVLAFDKNLISSEPLKFGFKIEQAPFPWITLALSILLLIALIALIWAIFSQRKIFQKSSELKQANRELTSARLDLANEAERERRRISRDLHDQTLADLRHLQLLTDKLPKSDESAENADVFRHEIENVSMEIRRICEDLSPSVLENIGFSAALQWALSNSLDSVSEDEKFEYEFICPEHLEADLKLTPGEQIQIYRITQEVLNNISQHAAATRVKMSVEKSPAGDFVLKIEDNGRSFDFEKISRAKGRGLSNIKSRASLIGAETSYSRSEPGGTTFTLTKPLQSSVESHI